MWYACCYCFPIKAQNELPKPSFLSFFWFILCFVKWNEKNLLLKDMKSREELFLLSLHIQRAMPETVATTKNEVNSAKIELRPLMCSIFFSSLFCRLREDEERTNEAREPAWAITVGFGTTVTRLATPLNRLRQDSLYRQFLVGQTPVNTTEPRYVLYVYYILKIHGVFEVHTTKIHFFFKYYKYCKDKWTLIL